MNPKALLLCGLLALLPAVVHAQPPAPRCDEVAVASVIYQKTVHLFVYTATGQQQAPASLPVVYVPGVGKGDHSFYARLNKLVAEGVMPPVLLVGIEPGTGMPDPGAAGEAYLDPKHLGAQTRDAESFYFAFIVGEVMPAIEKRYACAPYKTLYTDGAASFAGFVLKNYPGTFTTYLSLSPFALYDPRTQLRYAQGSLLRPGGAHTRLEEYYPDEHALKTGRPGWVDDQR